MEMTYAPADLAADAPQPGLLCSQCQIPGVAAQLAGDYVLQVCP